MNPNIAVLLGQLKKPSDEEYIEAISKAGGNPIVFRPGDNFTSDHLIETDGLLLTGGGDVHPKFYGEKKEPFQITCSIGVYQLHSQVKEVNKIFGIVDAALYKAKNSGRNCVVVGP